MKQRVFGSLLVLVFAFIFAGCPPVEEAGGPAGPTADLAKALSDDALVKSLNSQTFPPPPPSLEDTPDLHRSQYLINDYALKKMSNDGVPENVVQGLENLKGKTYSNSKAFFEAVQLEIGAESAEAHRKSLMRSALIISLDVEPIFPGSALTLVSGSSGESIFDATNFAFDEYEIKPEYVSGLRKNARILLNNSEMKVMIEGHCDERGTTEYNLALGERRARAVKRFLLQSGVPERQMKTISYGEERPLDPASTERAWAKNRRVVLSLVN